MLQYTVSQPKNRWVCQVHYASTLKFNKTSTRELKEDDYFIVSDLSNLLEVSHTSTEINTVSRTIFTEEFRGN